MKYTPSALVSEFSGKQGSTVASHNRFGPYLRNRVIPVNPNTVSQQAARNDLTVATKAWASLSAAQRAAWNAAASVVTLFDRLGRPYNPTGHQYFVSVNRTSYVYSGSTTVLTVPPTAAAPAALTTMTPTMVGGISQTASLAYTATPLAALTKLIVEATPQLSPGISFISRSQLRQLLVTSAAAASPANFAAAFIAKFGVIVTTRQVFVRGTVITSDGQRSAPLTASLIVG
jgi:hypothetical protein